MPTDAEIKGGVEHIVHDYATLALIGEGISRVPAPWNGPVEQSFIVNCRKFAHFFGNEEKGEHDDMFAKHYVDPSIRFGVPIWTKWSKHHDKHLFHLAYARVKNSRCWDGYEENKMFFDEIQAAWRQFLAVPPKFKDEFDRWIDFKERQLVSFGVSLR